MLRTLTIMSVATGLVACVPMPPRDDGNGAMDCDEPGGGVTPTNITYSNASLSATPVTNIRLGKKWRFNLNAVGTAYDDAIVTITGKTATAEESWISASGTEADSPLVICVPDDGTLAVGDQVYYSIDVQFIGMLDPRGDVVN